MIKADIVCLTETHLKENANIDVDGYLSFTNNRKGLSVRTKKGSGGVAILVKDCLLQSVQVNLIDNSHCGIIGIELRKKFTRKSILVYSCYLPPEGSPWADTTSFYGHLISQMYLNSFAENIFIAGDFNARIGSRLDFIEDLDTINKRCVLDTSVNSYCEAFLEFIKDVKMCIVNGRVTPKYDNYTCLNRNGCSVVDYIITDFGSLEKCKMCKVLSVNDLMIENSGLKLLLSSSCKAPDHSVILVEFEYGNEVEDQEETGVETKSCSGYRRYSFQNQNNNFLNNETWNYAMLKIIEILKTI